MKTTKYIKQRSERAMKDNGLNYGKGDCLVNRTNRELFDAGMDRIKWGTHNKPKNVKVWG